jgi:hypothetical protein
MGMVRREVGSRVKVMVVISILFFAGTSLAANEDEDLLKQANQIFGVLPKAVVSEKNPITPEKVHLGKILFYETRISIDGTISCSKCHPISLYGADGLRKAIGNNCKTNPRNSPTIFNAAGQISEHFQLPINYPAASSGVLSIFRHAGLDPASSRFLLWIPAFAGMTDTRQAAGYWTRSE